MSTKDDGGPAFPISPDTAMSAGEYRANYRGVSLRDYFAAAALQGILTDKDAPACIDQRNPLPEQLIYMQSAAEGAYRAADAMLAERAK